MLAGLFLWTLLLENVLPMYKTNHQMIGAIQDESLCFSVLGNGIAVRVIFINKQELLNCHARTVRVALKCPPDEDGNLHPMTRTNQASVTVILSYNMGVL